MTKVIEAPVTETDRNMGDFEMLASHAEG
jgi:hypothetical protein